MWIFVSKRTLRKVLASCLMLFLVVGVIFFSVQNNDYLPGGNIAPIKMAWLFLVIFCWFIIPMTLLFDCFSNTIKRVISLFLMSMLLRAVIELLMMFWFKNWHPYYGIAHDVFMILFCLLFSFLVLQKSRLIAGYLLVMAILFSVESGFAWYMLNNVHNESGVVYYVPADQSHQSVLQITLLVVLATMIYLFFFIRKWLYEAPPEC